MAFEQAHAAFLQGHLQSRTGERRGRLERGHREAEKLFCQKVWWEVQGNFDRLHGPVKLVIEIKGFGPHVRDKDRQKYCNELNRETFLTAMGFQVICFAYDAVANRPELCITLLRMVLNRYLPANSPADALSIQEREILRLACILARPLRPVDVETHLSLNHRTAVRTLQSMCGKGFLKPAFGFEGKRYVKYDSNNIMFISTTTASILADLTCIKVIVTQLMPVI
ncbi:endonuclease domain-containing protein [Paenibacillus sp. MBLB2552]|uniref:Endonuclease domain-containing protein n=1 Tax=Paenibacillus mellifer TaxID=2937794 RepID=A0A9X1Y3F8_9BACL|nr:endonuclease domain-containing protein [Paenibacillus mellifer]MCK8489853.1 endonuclease domain-containing protein [Paenibacillus mellifer]